MGRGERSKRKESVSPERLTRRSRSVVPGKEPFVLGILKKRSQSQCTRRKRSHSVSFLGVEVKEEYLGEVESYTQDDYLDEYMKTRGITVTVNDSKEEWIKPIQEGDDEVVERYVRLVYQPTDGETLPEIPSEKENNTGEATSSEVLEVKSPTRISKTETNKEKTTPSEKDTLDEVNVNVAQKPSSKEKTTFHKNTILTRKEMLGNNLSEIKPPTGEAA